ncbi:MAG: sigma 54-interacting transcriptional regulator, partial [Bacillota bacterium]|nr:sigma 54-interacting transcriptional regulator [Bacillota bacterium]
MSLLLQAKLLRVLQNREIMPVGGTRLKQIDVRVMAATNKDLKQLVKQQAFREDLYYRLEVIQLHLPPLRDRKEDLHLYIQNAMEKIGNRLGKLVTISPKALKALINYNYPGNIRELENILEVSIVYDEDNVINLEDLPDIVNPQQQKPGVIEFFFEQFPNINEIEAEVLKRAVKEFKSKTDAAKHLNISRATLYRKLKEYHIDEE